MFPLSTMQKFGPSFCDINRKVPKIFTTGLIYIAHYCCSVITTTATGLCCSSMEDAGLGLRTLTNGTLREEQFTVRGRMFSMKAIFWFLLVSLGNITLYFLSKCKW